MPLEGNIAGDPDFFPLWRSTRYMDKDGSPEFNLFFDRGSISRTIWVAHQDVEQAILDFCGITTIIDNTSIGGTHRALKRIIPANYPRRQSMYVQGVPNVTPHALRERLPAEDGGVLPAHFRGRETDDTPIYKMAEIVLQYVMPTFKMKTDEEILITDDTDPMQNLPDEGQALATGHKNSRYITKQVKLSGKMLTIPRGILKGSDNKLILEAIAINEHVADYIYTWHQVPEAALPTLTWILATNVVNDAVFDGHPIGTLLCCGDPELKMNPNPISQQIEYDVTYHFKSLRIFDKYPLPDGSIKGHNYVRRKVITSIEPLVTVFRPDLFTGPDGELIFRPFDFRRLFRPDPLP